MTTILNWSKATPASASFTGSRTAADSCCRVQAAKGEVKEKNGMLAAGK